MSRFAVVLVMFALTSRFVFAQPAPPSLSPETARKIETLIADEVAARKVPGVSFAVVVNRQPVWAKGFGMADVENEVPATAQTVYRLASVSKTVAAVTAMALVERGKLDLDAKVQSYVPSFPQKSSPITVRQLLCHQSGIRHYSRNGRPVVAELDSTKRFGSLSEGLALFQDDELVSQPGEKVSYTTHGYTLLGCVIEAASGMSFMDAVNEFVCKPAGLKTLRNDDLQAIIPHRAQGYRKTADGQLRNSGLLDSSYKIPGGGLCCSAEDMAKYAAALFNDKIVSSKTREQMWTQQKTNDGKETSMGLGWSVGKRDGQRVVSHSGAQQRVSTYLHIEPDNGTAVIFLCNLEGARPSELIAKIAELARASR